MASNFSFPIKMHIESITAQSNQTDIIIGKAVFFRQHEIHPCINQANTGYKWATTKLERHHLAETK